MLGYFLRLLIRLELILLRLILLLPFKPRLILLDFILCFGILAFRVGRKTLSLGLGKDHRRVGLWLWRLPVRFVRVKEIGRSVAEIGLFYQPLERIENGLLISEARRHSLFLNAQQLRQQRN